MSSKVSALLSNIFTRRKSCLETDAAPVSDRGSNQFNENDLTINSTSSLTSSILNAVNNTNSSNINNDDLNIPLYDNLTNLSNNALIPSTGSVVPHNNQNNNNINHNLNNNNRNMLCSNDQNVTSNYLAASSTVNNALLFNNTQGHIVYQFKDIAGLHIGNNINVQNNNGQQSSVVVQNGKNYKIKTRSIAQMLESNDKLDQEMIEIISTHLGKGWKNVMRKLNYSNGQIEQANFDHRDSGLKEVIFKLLLRWSSNNDATLGKITTILWNLNHCEVVYHMKQSWKESKKYNENFIQNMLKSNDSLDPKMIDTISTHLGNNWKELMRILNFSDGQIEQAICDYKDSGVKEVIYQLLLDWSRNSDNASLGEITRILKNAGYRDIVYIYMRQTWKEIYSCNCESET